MAVLIAHRESHHPPVRIGLWTTTCISHSYCWPFALNYWRSGEQVIPIPPGSTDYSRFDGWRD